MFNSNTGYDYFQSMKLWTYYDNSVTSNTLSFEYYTYNSAQYPKICEPKFKFSIISKSTTCASVNLGVAELYRYTYHLKKNIVDKVGKVAASIRSDHNVTDGFVHNTQKDNIYTTIMYNANINDACIRFMIGGSEKTLLDTDKIYVPLIDLMSLYGILNKSYEKYIDMCTSIGTMDFIRSQLQEIKNRIGCVEQPVEKKPEDEITVVNDFPKTVVLETIQASDDVLSENEEVSEEEQGVQNDFDDFLVKNVDSFDMDMSEEKIVEKAQELSKTVLKKAKNPNVKTVKDIELTDVFSSSVLKGDFKNIEVITKNCVNTSLPLDSFVKTVFEMCNVDLYDGLSDVDKYGLNYVTTKNLKFNVKNHIQNKVDFPKSIKPIVVGNNNYKDGDEDYKMDRIQIMYFLLMSYIYLGKVKTQLSEKVKSAQDNKEFLCYALKTITSCFVFSYMMNVEKTVLVGYIEKLYNKLRTDGFFNNFEESIQKNSGVAVSMDYQILRDEVSRIYDTVVERKDKLVLENFFNPRIMSLKYSDISKISVKFNPSVIDKICVIDTCYINKNISKVDEVLQNYDDVPINILNLYGIKSQKFDNSILLNYFKKNVPNFEDMEQIKNINVDVYDILENINIQNYSVNVLRALYFWNVKKLPKNIKLSDFEKMVDDSNLDTSMLISMILNRDYKTDNTFYNSLKVC